MRLWLIRKRLDELNALSLKRRLTDDEQLEMKECAEFITNEEWKEAEFFNLMYAARIALDLEWFDEISGKYWEWVRSK